MKKQEIRKLYKVYRRMFLLVLAVFILLLGLFLFITGLLVNNHVGDGELMKSSTSLAVIAVIMSLLIISQAVSVFWMKRISSPAEEISGVVAKVAQGEFDVRVNTQGYRNEMKVLGNNLNKMIEELNSIEVMRSDFVSNVSHEFRAPLSSIQGYVTLLSSPKTTEEQKDEYFELLKESTRQLSSLVDNVLKLSRLQSQNIVAQPVNYSLDEQLRRAVLMFEQQWSEKELELELELPECSYFGSEELLNQVWINLIGNAVKFTPPGGSIGVKILSGDSAWLKVEISDSGEGMSEEVRRHIFEKFYQGDSSRKAEGNGLGLALVHSIIQLTDSKIQVESQPGKGSRFTVFLPR